MRPAEALTLYSSKFINNIRTKQYEKCSFYISIEYISSSKQENK